MTKTTTHTTMKRWFLFLCPVMFFFCQCDPARRIDMQNKTSDTVEVIWRSKEDSIAFNPFVISNSRELKFTLPPHKGSRINMSFGVGTWSPKEVEQQIKLLESLEIVSPHERIKIDSLSMLRDYLLARRKGIGGSRIRIVISR